MEIKKNDIYLGDCLQLMEGIPDESIDLVLCDPPYGVLNWSNGDALWDKPLPMEEVWRHYKRIVKRNGVVVLFAQGMFTARLMVSEPEWWKYNLIWDKNRPTGFLNARKMPLRCHEDICVFYTGRPVYNPQMRKCLQHQRNHSRGMGWKEKEGTNRCYGHFSFAEQIITDEKYPLNIIQIPKEHENGKRLHPTQKPVDLMRYLIRTYSNEGYTVLDNCMGSGTTCVAAIKEKRNYIGMEKSESYFLAAKKRIEQQLAQPELF